MIGSTPKIGQNGIHNIIMAVKHMLNLKLKPQELYSGLYNIPGLFSFKESDY